MAPLLIHSDSLSTPAKSELRRALNARPERRRKHLEAAAKLMWQDTDLACAEIQDLIGEPA